MNIIILFQIAVIILAYTLGTFVAISNVRTLNKLKRTHLAAQIGFQNKNDALKRELADLKQEIKLLYAENKKHALWVAMGSQASHGGINL